MPAGNFPDRVVEPRFSPIDGGKGENGIEEQYLLPGAGTVPEAPAAELSVKAERFFQNLAIRAKALFLFRFSSFPGFRQLKDGPEESPGEVEPSGNEMRKKPTRELLEMLTGPLPVLNIFPDKKQLVFCSMMLR